MSSDPWLAGVSRRSAIRSRAARGWRMLMVVVSIALLAGVLGACSAGDGSASEPTSTQEIGRESDELAEAAEDYASCMREHGIDDFLDASAAGDDGMVVEGSSSLDASGEDLEAARTACESILGAVQPSGGGETEATEPSAVGWEAITPGGDCQCADGSDYTYYAREANSNKVVLFLDGGGACWSAETCDPDGVNRYQTTVDAPTSEGVFNSANASNPFADYSFTYVPYCTGDLHMGDATTEYAPGLTIQHKGYVNGSAALDYLATTYSDASNVVVIGSSAGSLSAAFYAGLVSEQLPDANVTVFADSSGAYGDEPELNSIFNSPNWGTASAFADWPESAAWPADQWSAPAFFIQSWNLDPNIVLARFDHAYDEDQASHLKLVGVPADDVLALIDANEQQIEDTGANLLSYTAPGDDHVIFDSDDFYNQSVNGTALTDWVAKILAGETVEDVHCTDCATGE